MGRTGFLTIIFLSCMLHAQNLNIENDQVRFLICEPSELLSYFDFINTMVSQVNEEFTEFSPYKYDNDTLGYTTHILIGDRLMYEIYRNENHTIKNGSEIETESFIHTIIFTSNENNYYLTSTREAVIRSNQTTQRIFTDILSSHSVDTLKSLAINDSKDEGAITIELFKKDLIEYLTGENIFDLSYTDTEKENECLVFETTQKNLEAFIETSDEIIQANMGKFDDIRNELYEDPDLKFKRIFEEEMEKLRNVRE